MRVDVEACELKDDEVLYEGVPLSGVLLSYYDDGGLREELNYLDGLPDGESKQYYPDGSLHKKWFCRNGRAEGALKVFGEDGRPKLQEWREHGVVVRRRSWDSDGRLREDWELPASSPMTAYLQECRDEEEG